MKIARLTLSAVGFGVSAALLTLTILDLIKGANYWEK